MYYPALVKGMATHVVPSRYYMSRTGGTDSARYCYSVFLRHLVSVARVVPDFSPRVVAEIGPGDSIGIGLAAVISGADHYYGLDVKDFATNERNLAIFDELVSLFKSQVPIPDRCEFPEVRPELSDWSFPGWCWESGRLAWALDSARLARLRAALVQPSADSPIIYKAPWLDVVSPNSVDWILSQAVMEHVDDLEATYRCCAAWLRPNGIASHTIDFRCHGTAKEWNGHLAYPDCAWRIVRGRRLFLVNRRSFTEQKALMTEAGFAILEEQRFGRQGGLPRHQLAERFQKWTDDDLATSEAFIVGRKDANR